MRATILSVGMVLLHLSAAVQAQDQREAFEAYTVEAAMPTLGKDAIGEVEAVRGWMEWLNNHGFSADRCGVDVPGRRVIVDIEGPDQEQRLIEAGFGIIRELDSTPLEGLLRTQSQYFDPGEIEAMLIQIAADHPAITNRFSIGTTRGGRTLWAIEISDNPGVDEDEPAIQFNAQHHAREVATSHVVMDVINTLTDDFGLDPDVTNWVNSYKTVCVPMVNPDGTQFVFDGSASWRKNRNRCSGDIGIDLNRNYPYRWGPAGCGSSSLCISNTYRGPFAASDLETQAMMALADQYRFVMATSYHSSGRFIDYPYACWDWGAGEEPMPEHAVIKEMMDAMAAAIFAVDGVNYSSFSDGSIGPLSGDDTSWYYAHMGAYPFIVEVGTSFEPPFSQVAGIVNRNAGGWRYLFDRLGQARIDVHVTSDCQAIEADVTLTDFVFDTGELPRQTFLPFGRWTFMVPANASYTIRVSKAGFVTQDVMVAVGNTPASVNVDLAPTSPPMTVQGDMTGDCLVNGLDIAPFVEVILDGPAADPAEVAKGDFDGNCLVNALDVDPFITAALAGATCP